LGDTIAKVTKATGIEKLVKFIAGEDCGCNERKEKLNKLFPYKRQPLCLNENEFFWWQSFKSQNATHLKRYGGSNQYHLEQSISIEEVVPPMYL
jgi:hypothetical protein